MNASIESISLPPPGARLRLGLRLTVSLLAFLLAPRALPAEASVSKEYQVKAVFLFNFLQFIEWPSAAFPAADTPIRIGVLGDDPFGSVLDAVIRDESIHGRPLTVLRSRRTEELQDCHLVFISRSEQRRIAGILSELADLPVFTVSEINGFARQGGIIALYPDGNKIRFEINQAAARRADLKLSSQLLDLGRIVGAETSAGGR